MIPFANPLAQVMEMRAEIDGAIARVLDAGRYVLGCEVKEFECEFASWLGVNWAVGVGNGTDAIHMSLRALNIGPGDEVILPSLTATATGTAVLQAGATPVFADVDPIYRTLDPKSVAELVNSRTRAVIAVHLYGQSCDMDALGEICSQAEIHLIEDCAQAHGARWKGKRVGSFGVLACFSFYPTKNLGAIGDGGAVTGNDEIILERVRLLREYGWKERYNASQEGWNSRLDELQAAILREKLKKLDADNARRRVLAGRYCEGLSGINIKLPMMHVDSEHVFHLFVIESLSRNELSKYLSSNGVGSLVHYPFGIHQQGMFTKYSPIGGLAHSEKLVDQILSIPMFPQLSFDDQDKIIMAIQNFHKK